MIPDDVIEVMADNLPYGDGDVRRVHIVWALGAAEAMGWKLVPREPNERMMSVCASRYENYQGTGNCHPMVRRIADEWRALHDAAPTVKP